MLKPFFIVSAAILIANPAFAQEASDPLALHSEPVASIEAESGQAPAEEVAEEAPVAPAPAIRRVTTKPKPAASRIISKAQAADEKADAVEAPVSPSPSSVQVTEEPQAAVEDEQQQEPFGLLGSENSSGSQGSKLASVGTGLDFILRFAFVLALAYLSVVGLKMYAARSGKPFKFGNRALVVEESTPLASGVYIHLVRLGDRRWLVGSSQSQISILSSLDEDDGQESQPEPLGIASVQITGKASNSPNSSPASVFSALESLLKPAGRQVTSVAGSDFRRRTKEEPPAARVAGELRKSAEFISEMRARLQDKA